MDANPDRTVSDCNTQAAQWKTPSAKPLRFRGHRNSRTILGCLGLLVVASSICSVCNAASVRTRNFIVDAPTQQLAGEVGEAAERYRDELATYWTGSALPPWPTPCPIRVVAGPNLAAQGVTTYNPAPVRDFQMEVIGTPERILDSVLPHEVTHTVLATYFGRPLPRWADEGICTTVEHVSERAKHEAKLREFLSTRRGIPMNTLMRLTEYPPDVLPMYAQGYSVCRFLIEQQGPQNFVSFLKDYMRHPSWTANVKKYYGYESLAELQEYWLAWVEAGSGPVAQFAKLELPSSANPNASSLGSRDIITRQASTTSASAAAMQPAPASRVAPATAIESVAANDRTDIDTAETESGWYLRRATGAESDVSLASHERPSTPEGIPTDDRIASATTSSTPKPTWAPPSVMASGRYSAATPQPETMGSIGAKSPASKAGGFESRGVNGGFRPIQKASVWR